MRDEDGRNKIDPVGVAKNVAREAGRPAIYYYSFATQTNLIVIINYHWAEHGCRHNMGARGEG